MSQLNRNISVLALVLVSVSAAAAGEDVDEVAGRIIGAALVDDGAWHKLAWLTDRIGARLSGSPQLEQAIEWTAEEFRRDGLDAVWTETLKVPHWVRGAESGRIVAPVEHPMPVMALGTAC